MDKLAELRIGAIEELVSLKLASYKLALSPDVITGAIGKRITSLGGMAPGLGQGALTSRTLSQLGGIGRHVSDQSMAASRALRDVAERGSAGRIQNLSKNFDTARARASIVDDAVQGARRSPELVSGASSMGAYRLEPQQRILQRLHA